MNNVLGGNTTINTLRIEGQGPGKSLDLGTSVANLTTLAITGGGVMLNGTDAFEIKRTGGLRQPRQQHKRSSSPIPPAC